MSRFLISIVREDGDKVFLRPGGTGERDLIQAIKDKGIGFLKTEAKVIKAIEEVLTELKSEVRPS